MDVLREILTVPVEAAPWTTVDAFWQRHRSIVCTATNGIDAAMLGGFYSETLAPAFACGYHAALRALVPGLPTDGFTSLCATEQGGAHPRSIRTRLDRAAAPGTYTVTGEKRWVTLSPHARLLLVVANAGDDPKTKRSQLRVVRVSPKAVGVRIVPMPALSFVPEIPHAEVSFDAVVVSEADILPGDGYEDYVKPFRTVEDIHVHAAALGYLVRVCRACDLGRPALERFVHLLASLRSLAAADPKDPITHLALAGILADSGSILRDIDAAFAQAAPKEYARFSADKPIFDVASRVRRERTTKAWERLSR